MTTAEEISFEELDNLIEKPNISPENTEAIKDIIRKVAKLQNSRNSVLTTLEIEAFLKDTVKNDMHALDLLEAFQNIPAEDFENYSKWGQTWRFIISLFAGRISFLLSQSIEADCLLHSKQGDQLRKNIRTALVEFL